MTATMTGFEQLVGQAQAVELLTQAIARERLAPAYLFAGPAGVGRRLAAMGFLEHLLRSPSGGDPAALRQRLTDGNHPDLLWVEPTYLHQGKRLTVAEANEQGVQRKSAPIIRLEQIREVAQFLARAPMMATRSAVVIEQAETMPEAAANALLKTLEEPGRATIILLAPGTDALLPTLVSRCQRIPFLRLSQTDVQQVLELTGHADILQQPAVLELAQGSPGAAIHHWETLQAVDEALLAAIQQGPRTPREALTLARDIASQLALDTQLWLVDYWQQHHWHHIRHTGATAHALHQLETARKQLQQRVQPRLVWEVALLALVNG